MGTKTAPEYFAYLFMEVQQANTQFSP